MATCSRLPGTIALGFIHPIAVALALVFALGFAVASVAGERQRGTLEVLLARPLSRRRLYLTLLVATIVFVAIAMAAQVLGTLDRIDAQRRAGRAPARAARADVAERAAGLRGVRLGRPGRIGLVRPTHVRRWRSAWAFVLVSYFLEIIGSLWVDARGLQPYSLFHYLDPKGALNGTMTVGDWLVPLGVFLVGLVVALIVFPRRDLAAPS